jgi:hypothetical protein
MSILPHEDGKASNFGLDGTLVLPLQKPLKA